MLTGYRPLLRGVTAVALCSGLVLSPTVLGAPPAAAAAGITVDGMNLDRAGTAVINALEQTQIAPGLLHVRYERLGADGWQQINVLKAELSDDTVRMKYLPGPTVSGRGWTVTELAERAGAVAGVNLDRFDINNSFAASGWGITDGAIVKSGNSDASASVGMTADGLGALVDLVLEGTAKFADDTAITLTGINTSQIVGGGVILYNSTWGDYSRARAFGSPSDAVEVKVGADGTVVAIAAAPDEGALDEGVQSLVAHRTSPAGLRLAQLAVGDTVDITYGVRDDALDVQEAGGAWHRLLRDGAVVPHGGDEYFTVNNPRTMIGFSEDRRTAYFVVVDGRTALAQGMPFAEQQRLMLELGAHDAINADGGGSSQMNVQLPGQSSTTVMNTPSDGFERHDGDGMGLVLAHPGSGRLTGFDLVSEQTGSDVDRVFPGLHRTLTANGHDEMMSPVDAVPTRWVSADRSTATVTEGVVRGERRGTTKVTAGRGTAVGSSEVQVLGELDRLSTDVEILNLETKGSTSTITVTGHDAQGFATPVEPRDVTVTSTNPDVFSVEPTSDGRFTITAIGDQGTATLRFTVGDVSTALSVAVPLEVRLVDDFSDISGWATAHDRAPKGGIEAGEGHEGSASIRLNYDFTESSATRGRYAVAPGAPGNGTTGGIEIPGRPQKISVWIKGDGNGSYLRLQVMQSNGVRNWIDGVADDGSTPLYATWEGWQRRDFVVPETFEFPLKLERIRALETTAVKQYTGALEFSKIYAYLPPDGVEAPANMTPQDEAVVHEGGTDDAPLRVAVMSDAQFVARDPESGAVEGARRSLREIVAADPDILVINGDFVDEAAPEDFALARRILDEELAGSDLDYVYVPGNHEIMGGDISNFEAAFGATTTVRDLQGTRLITLNTATGKLASDFSQVKMLREQLDDAATDPSVSGVVVFMHHPTDDPLPTKGSQLADRNEAELVSDWLEEFRATSGRSVALVASHVGVFHAASTDGVSYLVNGNAGKGPASTPENGGFTGWTMLGIDPADGRWELASGKGDERWLSAEVNVRVDELAAAAPARALVVGEKHDLAPTLVQDGDRAARVAWPMSLRWSSSGTAFVGDVSDAPSEAVVAVDPATSELTALRAGTASLTLHVNDATTSLDVTVEGGDVSLGGPAVHGATLTGSLGDWATGTSVAWQWLRDGEAVAGATGATYVLGTADLGARLQVRATVTADGREPVVLTSTPSAPVAAATQVAPAVSLLGAAHVGATLTASAGTWAEGTTMTFGWLRDGQAIPRARSSAYVLTQADLGRRISVEVTGHLTGHTAATARSAATAPVTAAPVVTPPTPEKPGPEVPATVAAGTVKVTGSAKVGRTLKASTSKVEKGATVTYQWLRNGREIAGATSRTYVATASDRGRSLSVRTLVARQGKVAASVTSRPTAKVVRGTFAKRPTPKISGTAKVGRTLTVKGGSWEKGTRLTYRWYRGSKLVKTTSKKTYKVVAKDRGAKLRVVVTAKKSGYASTKVGSKRTATVRR